MSFDRAASTSLNVVRVIFVVFVARAGTVSRFVPVVAVPVVVIAVSCAVAVTVDGDVALATTVAISDSKVAGVVGVVVGQIEICSSSVSHAPLLHRNVFPNATDDWHTTQP